jgi:tetratricopeptide (TPR) repeat protein
VAVPDPDRIRRPTRRRWRLPPPMDHETAVVSALEVMREFPGELGVFLWRSLRTVTLWAQARPHQRAAMAQPDVEITRVAELITFGLEPALEAPLATITALVGEPQRGVEEHVVLACSRVAHWANGRRAATTRLEFALAAALPCPAAPRPALAAGRAAFDAGRDPLAEAWFHRAIGLARQVGDSDSYARAHLGLAGLASARGAFEEARRSLRRAYRAAARQELREVEARALDDLFALELKYRRAVDRRRGAGGASTAA